MFERIQNQLARVVCKAPYRSIATDLLRQLHWLPVTQRIDYKILTTVYSVRQRRQPNPSREFSTPHQRGYKPPPTFVQHPRIPLLIPPNSSQ